MFCLTGSNSLTDSQKRGKMVKQGKRIKKGGYHMSQKFTGWLLVHHTVLYYCKVNVMTGGFKQ